MPSGIIYALPAPGALAPPALVVQTEVSWTGWDGSVWNLADPDGGVVLLKEGVEGLHMPPFRQWARQSPAVPGQVFTGASAEPRQVVLPVLLFSDGSSAEWVARDRAFWKSLHPAREGVLTISPAGAGSRRSLRLRLIPEDHQFALDPAQARWAAYSLLLVADQPFWAGPARTAGWKSATGEDFYEETGPHLVNIAPGHTTASASINNPGDEDAWPVWTVIGPATAAHMGVGDSVVEVPFTVADGKALVVDTDPRVQTAIEYDYTAGDPPILTNPVDRTADLDGAVDFAAIPAGGTSPLNVSITGDGTVRIELVPLYWRAW
jgi:hypothetical protein